MGIILNPDANEFAGISRQLYVDKTELIAYTNAVMDTGQNLVCFSRPRRFGKSYAAKMLAAFYSKGSSMRSVFEKLNIATNDRFSSSQTFGNALLTPVTWDKYLNQCNVLFWDMTHYTSLTGNKNFLSELQADVCTELKQAYSDFLSDPSDDLPSLLVKISAATRDKFYIIIDEWDAPFREAKDAPEQLLSYVDFLRKLFKSGLTGSYLHGAYMTGILPIKKYDTQSALSNFSEFTMLEPGLLAEFVGFTENEVKALCNKSHMAFNDMQRWYDGYCFDTAGHVYNPNSVIVAIRNHRCASYWSNSSSYESLRPYIELNFDGLRDAIMRLLGGTPCRIAPESFQNDMTSMRSRDDVLTLLVHLGYLAYDINASSVFIPNEEVRGEFIRAIKFGQRKELMKAIEMSDALLDATVKKQSDKVALLIEQAHLAHSSVQHYNSEQALRTVVLLAYLSATDHYMKFEELAGGRGFIDILFYPRPGSEKPALLIELKKDLSADKAVLQIEERLYFDALKRWNYHGEVLLIGINYSSKTNQHSCRITSSLV